MQCLRCGNCCRWEGCVKLTGDEPDRIAASLGLPVERFLADFCRITPDRQALALVDNPDHSCIFLGEENGLACCRIEEVKPVQCRDFPERWNFPNWRKECPGGAAEQLNKGS